MLLSGLLRVCVGQVDFLADEERTKVFPQRQRKRGDRKEQQRRRE